jgi:hypothetical protein
MSTREVTLEDYKFFDFLAPFRWPNKTDEQINAYRELVDTGELQIESLLENALALNSNGLYEKVSEDSRDATDNSDAKKCCSQFRNNSIARDQWMNTFAITNLQNKIGLIRALCYSKEQDEFYFFAIPNKAYDGMKKIDIILDQSTGYREPTGIPQGKWARYMVPDFKTLATITEAEAEELMPPSGRRKFEELFGIVTSD